MAINGLEGIVAPSETSTSSGSFDRYSYFVLEDVGLGVISAICKQNIKISQVDSIIQDFRGQKNMRRFILKKFNFLKYYYV